MTRPTYDSDTRCPSSSSVTLSFFLPYRGCAVRSRMMIASTSGSMFLCLLFFGAVLLGSSALSCPPCSPSAACQRKSVRRETPKAFLVARSPCCFQKASIFALLSTSFLFLILRKRIVLSHILNQPSVSLNLLNCRMFPQLDRKSTRL